MVLCAACEICGSKSTAELLCSSAMDGTSPKRCWCVCENCRKQLLAGIQNAQDAAMGIKTPKKVVS
ncbi:MAG: hypothetical protein M0021_14415 [Clostridia bacterium]|nr:hypothetical protein [Bacillota bacterium]MDA8213051.1 hypothetical protein [Clostridia bacterium]